MLAQLRSARPRRARHYCTAEQQRSAADGEVEKEKEQPAAAAAAIVARGAARGGEEQERQQQTGGIIGTRTKGEEALPSQQEEFGSKTDLVSFDVRQPLLLVLAQSGIGHPLVRATYCRGPLRILTPQQ